jgi:hypothetical protein
MGSKDSRLEYPVGKRRRGEAEAWRRAPRGREMGRAVKMLWREADCIIARVSTMVASGVKPWTSWSREPRKGLVARASGVRGAEKVLWSRTAPEGLCVTWKR